MHRDHDRRILAALALVNRDRVGESELVEVGEVVLGAALVEDRADLAAFDGSTDTMRPIAPLKTNLS